MKKGTKEITTKSHLIVEIDSHWTAIDFVALFDSINRLYLFHKLQDDLVVSYQMRMNELSNSKIFNELPEIINLRTNFYLDIVKILNHPSSFKTSDFMSPKIPFFFFGLVVNKIKYESPGIVDLLGIGKVLEQVVDLLKFYIPNKEKRSQTELIQIEIERKTIENQVLQQELINLKIENLKRMGFDLIQIQAMVGVEYYHAAKVKDLINRGNIVGLEIIEGE